MKLYGKTIIAEYEKRLDNEDFQVFVVDDGEYYNIHILCEKYKRDESNTMQLQEPKTLIEKPDEYFDNAQLIEYLMDFFIWDRFYREGIFTGYTTISFDKHTKR